MIQSAVNMMSPTQHVLGCLTGVQSRRSLVMTATLPISHSSPLNFFTSTIFPFCLNGGVVSLTGEAVCGSGKFKVIPMSKLILLPHYRFSSVHGQRHQGQRERGEGRQDQPLQAECQVYYAAEWAKTSSGKAGKAQPLPRHVRQ